MRLLTLPAAWTSRLHGWRRPGAAPPTGRPARTLARQQRELLLLYLGSLLAVLLVAALLVRGLIARSELAQVRARLLLIGDDLASLPLPAPGSERDLQESRKDFATAGEQVEWFVEGQRGPVARLGAVRTLGPLPKRPHQQRILWQEGADWLAVVRPLDAVGGTAAGQPPVWLRISEGLDPIEDRLRQLDYALSAAVFVALLLSGLSASWLTQRAVAPLERSLLRLRQFSLDASHELRGPLAALSANAELGLLESEGEGADQGQRRRFAAIASATGQMEQLVEDLLLLARQDELRLASPVPVDLSLLLEDQLALHQDGIRLKQLSQEVDLAPQLMVQGHPAELQRLFRNLLDNALRYNRQHGHIRLSAERRGGQVRVAVADSGCGLAAAHLPQVFDRFWRASEDRTDGGTGLGLAIASRICRAHGGRIQVSSELGQGSCFVVELPALRGEAAAASESDRDRR
jgi:signal transduction histidine kinase